MNNNLILKLKTDRNKQTILLLAIGIALVLISILVGQFDATPNVFIFFIGTMIFFFGLLRPWRKSLYYGIMSIIFIVLIILEFKIGIDIFMKIFTGTHVAEDIAWTFGGICFAGILAGIIGIFIFKKKRK